jgi:hypothetical protein
MIDNVVVAVVVEGNTECDMYLLMYLDYMLSEVDIVW